MSTSATSSSASSAKIAGAVAVAKKKRSYKEEQEFQGMEPLIHTRESRREHLRAQLIDPEVFKNEVKKADAMAKELSALDVEIERLYARWQILSDLPSM